jgi:hypothetical protein
MPVTIAGSAEAAGDSKENVTLRSTPTETGSNRTHKTQFSEGIDDSSVS